MYEEMSVLLIRTLEPLHIGAAVGSEGVDRPIARDARDGAPIIPFAALKGVLRDVAAGRPDASVLTGAPASDAAPAESRGAVSFVDAHPLLFPLRSARGGLALATSARSLRSFHAALALQSNGSESTQDDPTVRVPRGSGLSLKRPDGIRVIDLAGRICVVAEVDSLADLLGDCLECVGVPANVLERRLAVLPEALWRSILREETDVRLRTRIDATRGVVAGGALFSYEAVPRDTVLFSRVLALPPLVLGTATDEVKTATQALGRARELVRDRTRVIIGGQTTVGYGLCRIWMV